MQQSEAIVTSDFTECRKNPDSRIMPDQDLSSEEHDMPCTSFLNKMNPRQALLRLYVSSK